MRTNRYGSATRLAPESQTLSVRVHYVAAGGKNPPQTSSICLELIPQSKLHDARLRQEARIGSEIRRLLRKRRQQSRRSHRLSIEAGPIGHVKNNPAKMQAVSLAVRHLPALI